MLISKGTNGTYAAIEAALPPQHVPISTIKSGVERIDARWLEIKVFTAM